MHVDGRVRGRLPLTAPIRVNAGPRRVRQTCGGRPVVRPGVTQHPEQAGIDTVVPEQVGRDPVRHA